MEICHIRIVSLWQKNVSNKAGDILYSSYCDHKHQTNGD